MDSLTQLTFGAACGEAVLGPKVARVENTHPVPVRDERLKSRLDWQQLAWIWHRIWNPIPIRVSTFPGQPFVPIP